MLRNIISFLKRNENMTGMDTIQEKMEKNITDMSDTIEQLESIEILDDNTMSKIQEAKNNFATAKSISEEYSDAMRSFQKHLMEPIRQLQKIPLILAAISVFLGIIALTQPLLNTYIFNQRVEEIERKAKLQSEEVEREKSYFNFARSELIILSNQRQEKTMPQSYQSVPKYWIVAYEKYLSKDYQESIEQFEKALLASEKDHQKIKILRSIGNLYINELNNRKKGTGYLRRANKIKNDISR